MATFKSFRNLGRNLGRKLTAADSDDMHRNGKTPHEPVREEQEEEKVNVTAQVLNQDTALIQLLITSIRPYWRMMSLAGFFMLLVASLNVVPPYLLQQAIDGPIARGDTGALGQITLLYGATALALFVLTFAYTYFLQYAAQRALADLRTRLFDHILRQDYTFLTNTSTGDLVARLSSDIDNINQVKIS